MARAPRRGATPLARSCSGLLGRGSFGAGASSQAIAVPDPFTAFHDHTETPRSRLTLITASAPIFAAFFRSASSPSDISGCADQANVAPFEALTSPMIRCGRSVPP